MVLFPVHDVLIVLGRAKKMTVDRGDHAACKLIGSVIIGDRRTIGIENRRRRFQRSI